MKNVKLFQFIVNCLEQKTIGTREGGAKGRRDKISRRFAKRLPFSGGFGKMIGMNYTLSALDEYFAAHYSDYVRLSALNGYVMPEMIEIADGGVRRKEDARMRLIYQPDRDGLLARFKAELADTEFTFSFRFLKFSEKLRQPFDKYAFHRVLPVALKNCRVSAEEAGRRLTVEPKYWNKIVKGALIPEKGTVFALALVCGMGARDAENLMNACGYAFDDKTVRDVVVRFLIEQKIFSYDLMRECLAEYRVTTLPIR